ncbi:MAG: DUF1343 domain-containing protein, partial [Mucinivorans sp.]
VRGDVAAGVKFDHVRDESSSAMIYSLYGNGMKPQKEMLQDVDVLVFDIQDIGSRSYTFISTLGLAMEAAAQNGKKFMVLDRPNPLGGVKVEGEVVQSGFSSFVSKYPVPYIHGMTIGELARCYSAEKMLSGGVECNLVVIPMQGWTRQMEWKDTALPWVPTSPHIPHAQSTIYYPVSGMAGELQTINIGVGYTLPFELFAAEWITDAQTLCSMLNANNIPGVIFRPIHLTPFYGSARGKAIHGVQVHVTDLQKAPLTLLQFYVFQELHLLYPDHSPLEQATNERIEMFDKVMGSSTLRTAFIKGNYRVAAIKSLWESGAKSFLTIRDKYLLY